MRAIVIYESMFGATKAVAEAIATGISLSGGRTRVIRAADATAADLEGAELIVVGAPTHVHGLPRPSTRKGTLGIISKADGDLVLEPGADTARGVREWLAGLEGLQVQAAAFDTRLNGVAFFTGRASRSIVRALRRHGAELLAPPESFLVAKNKLVAGELERARAWGERVAAGQGRSRVGGHTTRASATGPGDEAP